MANWSLPTLTSTYTNFISEVSTRLNDATQQFSLASNASTATNVPTNAMAFDTTNLNWSKYNGSAWVTIGTTYNITTANAVKWSTGRSISITGDITYTTTIDGTANVTAAGALATVNTNVGAFGSAAAVPVITVNGKGLVTAVSTAALGTIATQAASSVALTGGSITGLTTLGLPLGAGVNTEGLLQWDNTNDLLRIGTGASTKVIADLDSTQTLSNKTITTAASGNLTSTSLNAALAELQTDIDTRAPSGANTSITSLTGLTGAISGATTLTTTGNSNLGNDATDIHTINGQLTIYGLNSLAVPHVSIIGDYSGTTTKYAHYTAPRLLSSVTLTYVGHISSFTTEPTAFTLGSAVHFYATQGALGAGSAVTNQTGFLVDSAMSGAGTNISFSGQMPSASNNYNLYMGGTAKNYLGGDLLLGAAASLSITGSGTIGYVAGAGGTVTQATSRTTAVTLNKSTGAITLFSAAGSSSYTGFTVNNSQIATNDTVVLSIRLGMTNAYNLIVTNIANGSFSIFVASVTGTVTEAPIINFTILKGSAS